MAGKMYSHNSKMKNSGMKGRMDSSYSNMIHEDHSAPANLPQGVVHKTYPKCKYMYSELDDTMGELDRDRAYDINYINNNTPDSKW